MFSNFIRKLKPLKKMDITNLQSAVATAQAEVDADNAKLIADQATLKEAQSKLDDVAIINELEGLSADQVAAINATLSNDPDNKSGIKLTLPETTV